MHNRMKGYPLRILVLLVITTAFLGCTPPEPAVYPPEPLPEVLASLPRRAKVLCLGNSPPDKGSVVLWSLPGRVAPDTDSGVSGYSGDELAWMGHCEPVQITGSYWDPYGAEYWVKIEYFDTVGWVLFDLISFE